MTKNTKNKLFIILLAISAIIVTVGAFLKINGNPTTGNSLLMAGLAVKLISILGLIFTNLPKTRKALK